MPAVEIIAVPCWSSWKTGISNFSLSSLSIIKQSGALISSRFIPPKVLPIFSTVVEKISASSESISISIVYFSFGVIVFYISYFGAKKRGTLINMGE